MTTLIKTACLLTYLLAIVGALTPLPFGLSSAMPIVAAVLLALHALELAAMFKIVRRYPGPLVDSIALTLLFGLLHWRPLAKAPA